MAKRAVRPIRIEGDVAYVALTRGFEAKIDVDDVPLIQDANWHVISDKGNFYAHRAFKKRPVGVEVKLHRVLLSPPPEMVVDHINGDGLDNRRSNLRLATQSQNHQNSGPGSRNKSGYKGVFYQASRGKWQACIQANKVYEFLGRFNTAEEAHAAYCDAASRLYGEFAKLD